jgi:hypothetical protein
MFICRIIPQVEPKHRYVLKSAQRTRRKSQFQLTAKLPHIVLNNLGEGEDDKKI